MFTNITGDVHTIIAVVVLSGCVYYSSLFVLASFTFEIVFLEFAEAVKYIRMGGWRRRESC